MPIDRANDPIAPRSPGLADEDHGESLRAIREGLAEVAAGRSRPFEDFEREFRARHGLPAHRGLEP
ncbi:MAG: hypothetical protein BGO49_22180 [Planctomycetales bacterium 71-10]|nr:MAG: hypothetical protein BGO49_22180 [Planctomycetales bacterium 71-10]